MLTGVVAGGIVTITNVALIYYFVWENLKGAIFVGFIAPILILVAFVVSYCIDKQIEIPKAAMVKLKFKNKDVKIEVEGPDNWVKDFW